MKINSQLKLKCRVATVNSLVYNFSVELQRSFAEHFASNCCPIENITECLY